MRISATPPLHRYKGSALRARRRQRRLRSFSLHWYRGPGGGVSVPLHWYRGLGGGVSVPLRGPGGGQTEGRSVSLSVSLQKFKNAVLSILQNLDFGKHIGRQRNGGQFDNSRNVPRRIDDFELL